MGKNHLLSLKYELKGTLTEAQCSRKEDGVRIRTGHESRMHALTAIACKTHMNSIYMLKPHEILFMVQMRKKMPAKSFPIPFHLPGEHALHAATQT